ncbi:MAG: S8 family serine peptidase [Planctomycetes bacterium]|nr:S8 family serine peptidase [Planctomycetota bacterium]
MTLHLQAPPASGDPVRVVVPDKVFGGARILEAIPGELFLHPRCGAREGGGEARDCASPVFQHLHGRPVSFHLDQLTLQLADGVPAEERARILERIGAQVLFETRVPGYLAARLGGGASLQQALDLLAGERNVRFAEPRYLVEPRFLRALPDDPLAADQWAIENRGGGKCFKPGADLGLLSAWDKTQGDPSVVVAILDSGMDLEHPDLAGQLYPRGDDDWNFSLAGSKIPADAEGHGTLVAGLVAALSGNGVGVSGLAPKCRLMPLKVDGLNFITSIVEALHYVEGFARQHSELRVVLNGSLSTGSDIVAVHDGIVKARQSGTVLFFATGNGDGEVEYPAVYPEVVAVGATGPDDRRKRPRDCEGKDWGSNFGPELDLVAPGVLLPSTDLRGPRGEAPGDYHLAFGGTSAASPIAASVAALLLSVNPALTPDEVKGLLQNTAEDQVGDPKEDSPGYDPFMGWGRVNAARAVQAALEEERFQRGDADRNGAVNMEDAFRVLNYLFVTGEPLACPDAGDVNDDGDLDISDPIRLIGFLFQGGPAPEPPFPGPGLDLTRDRLAQCR